MEIVQRNKKLKQDFWRCKASGRLFNDFMKISSKEEKAKKSLFWIHIFTAGIETLNVTVYANLTSLHILSSEILLSLVCFQKTNKQKICHYRKQLLPLPLANWCVLIFGVFVLLIYLKIHQIFVFKFNLFRNMLEVSYYNLN